MDILKKVKEIKGCYSKEMAQVEDKINENNFNIMSADFLIACIRHDNTASFKVELFIDIFCNVCRSDGKAFEVTLKKEIERRFALNLFSLHGYNLVEVLNGGYTENQLLSLVIKLNEQIKNISKLDTAAEIIEYKEEPFQAELNAENKILNEYLSILERTKAEKIIEELENEAQWVV